VERIAIESISVHSSATIRDAMALLDRSAKQIVLVVEPGRKLIGVVTDGDIRRGLLGSMCLEDSVALVMNPNFHYVRQGFEPAIVSSLMASRGIQHLPVISQNDEVVELIRRSESKNVASLSSTVVIMAGGRGSRLRPLTDEVPKPMLTVGGIPILEIVLRNYASQGLKNFIISVGYRGRQIRDYFGDGSFLNVSISYLDEDQPLGTAGVLSTVAHLSREPILVSNADVISSINLVSLLKTHAAGAFDMTVATKSREVPIQYGVLEVEDGQVRSWREKPKIQLSISAGIYAINSEVLHSLPTGYADVPDIVDRLLADGRSVGAHQFDGLWIDVGSHEELQTAIEIGHMFSHEQGSP